MDFGKHRGRDCKWIAVNEPSYILWAKSKTDWKICDKLLTAAQKVHSENCHHE